MTTVAKVFSLFLALGIGAHRATKTQAHFNNGGQVKKDNRRLMQYFFLNIRLDATILCNLGFITFFGILFLLILMSSLINNPYIKAGKWCPITYRIFRKIIASIVTMYSAMPFNSSIIYSSVCRKKNLSIEGECHEEETRLKIFRIFRIMKCLHAIETSNFRLSWIIIISAIKLMLYRTCIHQPMLIHNPARI